MTSSTLPSLRSDSGPIEWMTRSSHQRQLCQRAKRLVPTAGSHSVQDYVQETQLRSLQGVDRVRANGKGGFRAWVRGILDNVIASAQRRHAKAPAFTSLDHDSASGPISSIVDNVGGTPCELAMHAETAMVVRSAVAKLPLKYQEVITLRYESGLKCAEIAAVLGIDEKDVHNRIYWAIKRLGRLLREKSV